MSIIAYVGLPGSGKSFDAVKTQILPALDMDRRIVTNIPLDRDAVRERTRRGEIVNLPYDVIAQEPSKIDEYATGGSVLILDEVWRLWPAGEKANRIHTAYKTLLAEHRHRVDSQGRSMQICLVVQDLSMISAFARQLVEQTFHHTKLTEVGARSAYRIDVFHGAVTGAVPPINNRIREIFGKYDPKIFKLYKSHTMREGEGQHVDEVGMDVRGNALKRPSFWIAMVAAIGGFVWGVSALGGLASNYGVAETSVASSVDPVSLTTATFSTAEVSPPSSLPVRASSHGTVDRRPARNYKLVGTVENLEFPEQSVALVSDGKVSIPIRLSDCLPTGAGQYECNFDGHVVTTFGARRQSGGAGAALSAAQH